MHLYTMAIALKWTVSGRAELNCTILTPNFVTTLIATSNPDALDHNSQSASAGWHHFDCMCVDVGQHNMPRGIGMLIAHLNLERAYKFT